LLAPKTNLPEVRIWAYFSSLVYTGCGGKSLHILDLSTKWWQVWAPKPVWIQWWWREKSQPLSRIKLHCCQAYSQSLYSFC